MTETNNPETTNYKGYCVTGLRFIQLLAVSMAVVGFIWGTGDFVSALLPKSSAVTPFSVLLMLYGVIGSGFIEVAVRFLQRKK